MDENPSIRIHDDYLNTPVPQTFLMNFLTGRGLSGRFPIVIENVEVFHT